MPAPNAPTLAERGPALGDAEFRRIAAILHEDSGIHLPPGKTSLVYSRLAKRLRALGLESFRDYCTLITSEEGLGERQAMLSALTTNVTHFFRETHHFIDLASQLRNGWASRVRSGGKLRIWSAACSSGEEAYSAAMILLAEIPDIARYDVRILATDIDPVIVAKARAGIYPQAVAEHVPKIMRDRCMERQADGTYAVSQAVRDLVAFNELNLMADWPMKGRFDAIFCRNVAIYFEEATQERLWGRFAPMLAPDGRLYVGHSERVGDPRFKSDGLTAYRLANAP
ncbi:protein-glutamate O-methyltransferase CheR [Caulobacter sp. NIBR1757]|uniref:CheR family methyltransferase n=1 Tax=Caulobacter sp. NIBR1757 TaxID=3016000 RepID=UPI0022F0D34A|nr:protein-glutamate O-methyltransferase CheR [Caulobacter sp. NIBR1757]WGM38330.1 Chemotaxis protein methyltransferase [Caulobacter sp. NIBR1757]